MSRMRGTKGRGRFKSQSRQCGADSISLAIVVGLSGIKIGTECIIQNVEVFHHSFFGGAARQSGRGDALPFLEDFVVGRGGKDGFRSG